VSQRRRAKLLRQMRRWLIHEVAVVAKHVCAGPASLWWLLLLLLLLVLLLVRTPIVALRPGL
jgi:hypothetical protein